jgi:hypothetical protein
MVTLLAFVVLTGGTAVALNGSNTVQSDDIGPGAQVKAPDIATNAVNGPDVVDNSLGGADVNESTLAVPGAPAEPVKVIAETLITGTEYSASDPSTYVDVGSQWQLRSPATDDAADLGFRLCNKDFPPSLVAFLHLGGDFENTSDIRSAISVGSGCLPVNYNANGTGAVGDFELRLGKAWVVGTGSLSAADGRIDIFAIQK